MINYKNIFLNSGLYNAEPSFNINDNIWNGWKNQIYSLPELSNALLNTGLRQKINLSLKFSYTHPYKIFNIFENGNYITYGNHIL